MASTTPATTLPAGSLILVTGATGYIAGHVVQEFLARGYRVRGTVRDLGKARWLVDDVFRSETAKGLFELVEVKDMSVEGAYVEAVKGVDAVVHVASNMNLDSDPNVVVPGVVAGVRSALTAAAKEATVTRFVLTSSIVAAADVYDPAFYSAHVKEDSWNEAALAQAWAPPPYDGRGLIVYEAAKIEAEKALWRFVDEEKPRFVANTVLPFLVYGPLLHEKMNQSTTGLIFELERGEQSLHSIATNVAYVDVRDVALLHVAAVIDPELKSRRLYAWAHNYTWNDVVEVMRKLYPEKKFMDDFKDMKGSSARVDNEVSEALLKKWGQHGWTSLETCIKDTLEGKRPT